MQHSQLRNTFEEVKLFAKASSTQTQNLEVYEFVNGSLINITPNFQIETLNTGYFSTVITTPGHSCYLIIKFCGNPIVLRVGKPELEFFFWAPKQKTYQYKHFDEFGSELDSGILQSLGLGFYYTTPISDELGYIEVLGKPYVIHVPYCSDLVGIGIDIDWKSKIIRQTFGISSNIRKFNLNNRKQVKFNLEKKNLRFSINSKNERFNLEVKSNTFKVNCKGV